MTERMEERKRNVNEEIMKGGLKMNCRKMRIRRNIMKRREEIVEIYDGWRDGV